MDELNLTATETETQLTDTESTGSETAEVSRETPETSRETSRETPETRTSEPLIKDGKVNQTEAFNLLRELKAKNPEHAKQLKAALYDAAALRSQFPGGMKEVTQAIAQIEEFGGLERLPELQASATELARIDELYDKADPSFVDGMIESNPEAFKALMPVALEKFRQADFAAYSSLVAPDILAAMDVRGSVRDAIEGLSGFAEQHPEVKRFLGPLIGYYNSVFDLAQKAGQAGAKAQTEKTAPDQLSQREKDVAEREQKATVERWQMEREAVHNNLFNSTMARIMEGRPKPTPEQAKAIGRLYNAARQEASFEQKHVDTVNRYLAAKDADGFKRYMAARYKELIPRLASEAVDTILKHPTLGKRAAAMTAPKTSPAAQKPGSSFTPVAKKPDASEIDPSKTDSEMYFKHKKAVLRDGRRVSWS